MSVIDTGGMKVYEEHGADGKRIVIESFYDASGHPSLRLAMDDENALALARALSRLIDWEYPCCPVCES